MIKDKLTSMLLLAGACLLGSALSFAAADQPPRLVLADHR